MNPDQKELRTTLCLLLVAVTVGVYWQVATHEFLNYDDQLFVYANSRVYTGLTWDNVKWAFSTLHGNASYWHPLTWLSHQLDCQLFGLRPGVHHLTNLWFHAVNTALLFGVLHGLTRKLWCSFWVAGLFALHPLHIETVAWVAERKSLLCSFFWLLTILAYVRYARHPTILTYLPVLAFCAASLMSKPMAVTLPFVLLVLDFWPLRRLRLFQPQSAETNKPPSPASGRARHSVRAADEFTPSRRAQSDAPYQLLLLLLEKMPLFALAATVAWLTIVAQKTLGAMPSLKWVPLDMRLGNTVVAYFLYIRKMIWPVDLAVIYPLLGHRSWSQVAGCALLLLFISFLVIRFARSRPYLLFGWAWYLGTLVPVIGIVQVGSQAMADRYAYVPLIGLFISLVWGLEELTEAMPRLKQLITVGASLVIAVFGLSSAGQLRHWKNTIRLFERATKITPRNHLAHHNLGLAFLAERNRPKAKYHFYESLKIRLNPEALKSFGSVLFDEGDYEGALYHYSLALQMNPNHTETHGNLANLFQNCPHPKYRNRAKAAYHARRACELTGYLRRDLVVLLARIYASDKQFGNATDAAQKALALSVSLEEIQDTWNLLNNIQEIKADQE